MLILDKNFEKCVNYSKIPLFFLRHRQVVVLGSKAESQLKFRGEIAGSKVHLEYTTLLAGSQHGNCFGVVLLFGQNCVFWYAAISTATMRHTRQFVDSTKAKLSVKQLFVGGNN